MTNKPVNKADLVCRQHTAPGDACVTLYGLCLTLTGGKSGNRFTRAKSRN